MSKDTIYREDAIGACAYETLECYEARKTIRALPSADRPQSDDWEKYSDRLWKIAYERGKASVRPQGEWIWSPRDTDGTVSGCCSNCSFSHLFVGGHTAQYNYCPSCGCRMKGADDE